MKIWYGYGSDHSANLVLIGKFKSEADAEHVLKRIHDIMEKASSDLSESIIGPWDRNEQISEEMEAKIRELKIHGLSPNDLAEFALMNCWPKQRSNELHFRTDDTEIGGVIKFMVHHGARVEVYCAYDHASSEEE